MAEIKPEAMETKKDGGGVVAQQQPMQQQQQQQPQQNQPPNAGPKGGNQGGPQGNRQNMGPKMMGFGGGRGGGNNRNRGSFGRKDRNEPYGRQSMMHHGGGGGGNARGNGSGGGGGGGGGTNNHHSGNQFGQFFSMSGPTTNLPTKEVSTEPKKFTGRCRLFVGNLTVDITEEEFRQMFEPFGEFAEAFLNPQKGFGFIKMDTRTNAENARAQLDGTMRKGRVIRVRLAAQMSAVRVRNLSPWISNELLEMAFSLFGEVERAVVSVDERGKPLGEGIVEFARKPAANMAIQRCANGNFLLTASPKPVIVEPLDQKDEEDGFPEKSVPKNSVYLRERDVGPRFTQHGTFENDFCNKWKQLFDMEKQKREVMEKEIALDRDRLEEQMELALYEQETNILREKLRQREQDANNLLREREMRRRDVGDRIINRDEQQHHRQHEVDMMRRPHDDFNNRNRDVRRQQEDNLLMQANQLSNLLEQQEAAFRQIQSGAGPVRGPGPGPQSLPVLGGGGGGVGGGGGGGPAGPVSVMDGGGMTGAGGGGGGMGGPNNGGMQMPRPNRFEQQVSGPPSSLNKGNNNGPIGHNMGRGGGNMGGIGNMGMGLMRGGGGGGGGGMGNRRDAMDRRDDFGDPKRRRF